MKEKLGLENIGFNFFEAHEGKNVSDTIGSIVKCAFIRGIQKNDEGLQNLSDMLSLIKSELKESTAKFEFFAVEEFGETERVLLRNELVIPNITKVHIILMTGDDLVAQWWTCLECRVNVVCERCKKTPIVSKFSIVQEKKRKPKKKKNESHESEESEDSETESAVEDGGEENFYDSEDNGYTDQSDSDEDGDSENDDENMGPGDVVWALYGRTWYPGRLCDMVDVPENSRKNLKNPNGKFIVKWYGEDQYNLVSKIEILAENRIDAQRASRSADMQQVYNLALEDVNN